MYRWMTLAMAVMLGAGAARAEIAVTDAMRLKDPDGKTFAVVLDCPQPGKDGATFGGSQDSMIGNDRCGKCLIDANFGVLVGAPYDLQIKGMLVDEAGQPLKDRLLHLFMPNGWTIKTRTFQSGEFRFLMGAVGQRKSDKPVVIDLGTKRRKTDSKDAFYALYLMPERFKGCPAAEKPAAKSGGEKKKQ